MSSKNILFKNKYKKLYKQYQKLIKKTALADPLDLFLLQLRFVRDYYLLMEPLTIDSQDNVKTATITTAIAEYEAYYNCVSKYFDNTGNLIIPEETDKTPEQLREEFAKEKAFHWSYFWELVKLNIESWLEIYVAL